MSITRLWGRGRRASASALAPTASGHGRPILFGAWALVAVAWAIALASVAVDHRSTISRAETEMAILTRAYAEHVSKTLQGADQALRVLRAEHQRLGQALDIRALIGGGEIIDSDFHQLGIIDAEGFLSHSSVPFTRVDLRDREHFRVQAEADAGTDRLFVSKPVLGKASGKWSIQLTRRIRTAEGRFGGVAVVSLPPSLFSGFFQRTSASGDTVTSLTGTDGVVRARSPEDKGLGTDVSRQPLFAAMTAAGESGTSRQLGAIDGVERLWAFRRLPAHGLFVISGRPMASIIAPWQLRSATVIAGAALFTLCVLGLAMALRRHLRQQEDLVAALRASTTQLRAVVHTMVEGSTKVAEAGSTMSVSAQTLAIRTDQQGDQLGVASGRVREAVEQVRATTLHVGTVDTRCEALREQTRSGAAVVARGVEAIEGIAARTHEMRETVAMIESIAFQTNILALNAAIEAARAGDAGRAFAVVAAEVRALAARSHESAVQVRELIARAIEQAGVGAREAGAVRGVLEGISSGVEAVADEMRAVSDEARLQSDSLQQVLGGLDDLSSLTRSNADMVAESVMAAEDMREHAQRLRRVVEAIERDLPPDGDLAGAPADPATPMPARAADPATPPVSGGAADAGRGAVTSPSRAPVVPRKAAAPAPAEAAGVEFF